MEKSFHIAHCSQALLPFDNYVKVYCFCVIEMLGAGISSQIVLKFAVIPHSVALDNEELDDTSDKNERTGERVPGREEIHIEDKAEAVQATEKDAESSSDEELHEKPE